jgi:4-amino-4-deoxy-L-arabinose transferase-like glycosyltransferase
VADPVVWGLVLAGLALRLVVGALLGERGFVSDEAEYYAAARVLADGRGFSYYDAAPWLRPPGYLLFLAGCFRLFGEAPAPARWLQVGLSLALGPLVAWLGWLTTGRRAVARLAAGATLLLLPLAVLPWLLLTETLFTLALLLAIGAVIVARRGGGWGWLAAAGLALGGACLLRGLAAGYVGLVALGLALAGRGDWRARLRDAALVAAVAGAVIAPWTLRNWLAYRAVVPLETTAAYNLWLRAQGGRGETWMLSELLEQPDPPRRQAHALQRGLALVRQDPAGYLARGWRELGDVVRLNAGAAERFMAGYSAGEVSREWLALTLLFDDALYLAVLPLAVVGLARRGGPGRWLTLGWLGWTALAALIFFAISRFRAPLLPLLALQAAIGLVELPGWWRSLRAGRPAAWATAALAVGLLAVALPSVDLRVYRDGWQARWVWEQAQAAEARRRAGDPAEALARLAELPADNVTVVLARGLALAQLGRIAEAEAVLAGAGEEPRTLAALGEVRRRAGDPAGAARLWNTRAVDVANPLEWAWGRLNEPGARVDAGDGLDLGLARGLHGDERDGATRYRWSTGHAELRLRPAAAGCRLTARLRAERPPGRLPVPVTVLVDGRPAGRWQVDGAWRLYEVYVHTDGGEVVVELASPTFVPGYADARALGVMIDWVECRPA